MFSYLSDFEQEKEALSVMFDLYLEETAFSTQLINCSIIQSK